MPSDLKKAVIATLAYSDVFDYPLTAAEITGFLHGRKGAEKEVLHALKNMGNVRSFGGFYFFRGRKKIVDTRLKKEKLSLKKLVVAEKYALILSFLPSVRLIAITGSLALLSSGNKDDIDLLIVTSEKRLWSTRFICVLILKFLGVYRNPKLVGAPGKICLNMFMDREHLSIPSVERDLYSAREIVQMRIIVEKKGSENAVLRNNPWVRIYLPNAYAAGNKGSYESPGRRKLFLRPLLDFLELTLKKFQLLYMKSKRTKEVIREGYLRFHPRDARENIIAEYDKRLMKHLDSEYTP